MAQGYGMWEVLGLNPLDLRRNDYVVQPQSAEDTVLQGSNTPIPSCSTHAWKYRELKVSWHSIEGGSALAGDERVSVTIKQVLPRMHENKILNITRRSLWLVSKSGAA